MGRKNLYIPDEHEVAIERLEKVLERSGQSLSDFFIQSVRNAVPRPARGRGESEVIVNIPCGATCYVAVDSTWRHSNAINALVGSPDPPAAKATDASLIWAKILRSDDPFGLWIELNSEKQRYPDLPVLNLVIPWRFVWGICIDPEDRRRHELKSEKRYGLPNLGDVTSA